MSLVAYVSGHGLGHSTREIEILRRLPDTIPLVVKTSAPEAFWREELHRSFDFVAASFDVGCIQKNGLEIDIPATLDAWLEKDRENKARLAAEVDDIKRRGAKLILSDVAAFPFTVAAQTGIPSICVANFTWADIYRAFIAEDPRFEAIADVMQAEYAQAPLLLEAGFSLPMPYFKQCESVGLIARPGISRRAELFSMLPKAAQGKRLALVYVSGWGLPIDYARLSSLTEWHFISLNTPQVLPPNWSVLPRQIMPHPDFVASVDVMVSKAGYGIATECLWAGVPLLYPPRPAFAEYAPLDAVVAAWAGGLRIGLDTFIAGDWAGHLARVPLPGSVPKIAANGGEVASTILTQWYQAQ